MDRRRSIYRPPWRIDVTMREGVVSPMGIGRIAESAARALEAANSPRPASVAVVLTDDEELAALNEEHMGHEGPTDVLSFPMLEPEMFRRHGERHSKWSMVRGLRRLHDSSPRGRIHIGDIAISVERAAEQAEQGRGGQTGDVRWSVADELRLLVTHGTLHLCGWDHAEPAEEAEMRALERRLLGRR